MYIHYTLGAIFIVYILCVHCDNASKDNEIKKISVPSAPQNLTADFISEGEVHLWWAPPLETSASLDSTNDPRPEESKEPQGDEPNDVLHHIPDPPLITPEILKETPYNYYRNEKKYDNEFSSSGILMDFKSKRDLRTHRHRKRRQDNATESENTEKVIEHWQSEHRKDIVKKSMTQNHQHKDPKDSTAIAYVLYYEQGSLRRDFSNIHGVQKADDVRKNAFQSDLGMSQTAVKNLTLYNTSGKVTKVVGFWLKNLNPFTPYKIWVRAFYNFSHGHFNSSDVLERLGPESTPLYVMTDVRPPSAPIVLNLTCDQPKHTLNLQWRQPLYYNNSLDQYVVTLRKIPEQQPRTRLTLPTNKNDIETTISVTVEFENITRYEVIIYAVTRSVAREVLVNGTQSAPEEVSSEWCSVHWEAMPPSAARGVSTAALLAVCPLALLAAIIVALIYWRCRSRLGKCISAAYNYLEEGGERAARAPLNKKPGELP